MCIRDSVVVVEVIVVVDVVEVIEVVEVVEVVVDPPGRGRSPQSTLSA